MSELNKIQKGTLFAVSTGCYSDYAISGIFRALDDLDPATLRDEYLRKYPVQSKQYAFESDKFLAWLIRRKLIEDFNGVMEWHLSDYSTADMWTGSL